MYAWAVLRGIAFAIEMRFRDKGEFGDFVDAFCSLCVSAAPRAPRAPLAMHNACSSRPIDSGRLGPEAWQYTLLDFWASQGVSPCPSSLKIETVERPLR